MAMTKRTTRKAMHRPTRRPTQLPTRLKPSVVLAQPTNLTVTEV